jgi:hypothetical protein
MILNWRLIGLGAAGGAMATAMAIWPLAKNAGWSEAQRDCQKERQAAERVVTRLVAERDQARGQVDKVNAAIAAQVAELAGLVAADQSERTAAAKRMESVARRAADEAKLAGERALAAREVIQNVADQCARAGVPGDVVRVLRDLAGDAALTGGGGLPAAPADRRP